MGVDYSSNFGVGVQVDTESLEAAFPDAYDVYEAIEELIGDNELRYFQYGDGAYTGEENNWCIILEDPKFNNLKELESQKAGLLALLSRNKIKHGPFELVGGLHIY